MITKPPKNKVSVVNNPIPDKQYQKLLAVLRREIARGVENIQKRVIQEKIRMHWNIGRHIDRELLKGSERAPEFFYQRLSDDLHISGRTLQDVVRFYRAYPKMPGASGLTWTHYHILLSVADDAERRRLEARVIKDKIGIDDLRLLVRAPEAPLITKSLDGTLKVIRGTLFAYRVIKVNSLNRQNFLTLDCGFDISFYQTMTPGAVYASGKLCRSVKIDEEYSLKLAPGLRMEDLYTYQAIVERFIDGDTLLVNVDVGFGIWSRQKLRFRGLDCPELATQDGLAAKKYVEAALGQCPFVAIKTYKADKYDRYLVDVFYLPGKKDAAVVAAGGKHLNQELIDRGLAKLWE